MKLPRLHTPVSPEQSAALLMDRYANAFGHMPDRNTAMGLLTLLWHENAQGRAVTQHNWGNVIVSRSNADRLPHYDAPWLNLADIESMPEGGRKERYMRLHEQAKRGEAPSHFRAHPSHEAGLDAWLRTLTRPRFQHIIRGARTGNPDDVFLAVSNPNPATPDDQRIYCPHCTGREDVQNEYRKLHAQIEREGHFAHLPETVAPREPQPQPVEPPPQTPRDGQPLPAPPPVPPKKKSRAPVPVDSLSRASDYLDSWRPTPGHESVELPVLEMGMQGPAVVLWQKSANHLLRVIKSPPIAVDGKFGPKTHAATQDVQQAYGLAVDGVVGLQTWSVAG